MEQEYKKSNDQYDAVIEACKKEFLEKYSQYGNSLSNYDDIFDVMEKISIKLTRVKRIQKKRSFQVEGESVPKELPGIINYCIYAIMSWEYEPENLNHRGKLEDAYNTVVAEIKSLFAKKNDDYGEAWRTLTMRFMMKECIVKYNRAFTMYCESLRDPEKMKDLKKELKEVASDICNYTIFCAILISEGRDPMF